MGTLFEAFNALQDESSNLSQFWIFYKVLLRLLNEKYDHKYNIALLKMMSHFICLSVGYLICLA